MISSEEQDQSLLIRPSIKNRILSSQISPFLETLLQANLGALSFSQISASTITLLKTETQKHLKTLVSASEESRYKFITEIQIVENRGEGLKSIAKCLWDSDTDLKASFVLSKPDFIACITVFAVYFY